jgi:cytochrome c oxidase cbb3-type subunit 4
MDMDINTLRSIATVASFLTFIGIVWWAWSRRGPTTFLKLPTCLLSRTDLQNKD